MSPQGDEDLGPYRDVLPGPSPAVLATSSRRRPGTQNLQEGWIPAFAGMTRQGGSEYANHGRSGYPAPT